MNPILFGLPIYESKLVPAGKYLKIWDTDGIAVKALVVNSLSEFKKEMEKQNEEQKEKAR